MGTKLKGLKLVPNARELWEILSRTYNFIPCREVKRSLGQ